MGAHRVRGGLGGAEVSAQTKALSTDPYLPRGAGLDTEIGTLGVLTEATVRSAQLEVCSRVVDVGEARELLAMLGIGDRS